MHKSERPTLIGQYDRNFPERPFAPDRRLERTLKLLGWVVWFTPPTLAVALGFALGLPAIPSVMIVSLAVGMVLWNVNIECRDRLGKE